MTIDELRRVSVLLRTVAEAEVARLEGDGDRVASLLDGVDPVEARGLANVADFDAGVKALRRREAIIADVLRIPGGRTAW